MINAKTLIAIGDPSLRKHTETSSFTKFRNYSYLMKEKNIKFIPLSYRSLFAKKLPEAETDTVIVLLFFPYVYWNKNIEIYPDGRIYGDTTFGKIFYRFFTRVAKRVQESYKNKRLIYVNPPSSIKKDRDKIAAKRIFTKNRIPTPKLYKMKDAMDIMKLLSNGNDLFIKPRFGAMGKGVTYMLQNRWYTNFIHTDGKVISPPYDYKWEFNEITGNIKFLENLLKAGSICEEAIESPTIGKKRFDLRIYVIYGKVPYIYARTIKRDKFVTNWSQGGKIKKGRFLNKIPPSKLKHAEHLAVRTAKALKMNFCGVDIIFSDGFKNAYVLEAQSFPSYESGFDLFGYLIDCIGGLRCFNNL